MHVGYGGGFTLRPWSLFIIFNWCLKCAYWDGETVAGVSLEVGVIYLVERTFQVGKPPIEINTTAKSQPPNVRYNLYTIFIQVLYQTKL